MYKNPGDSRYDEDDGGAMVGPIVAVTASALQQDLDRALALGVDGPAPKPIDWMLLSNTLAFLLPNPELGSGGRQKNLELGSAV